MYAPVCAALDATMPELRQLISSSQLKLSDGRLVRVKLMVSGDLQFVKADSGKSAGRHSPWCCFDLLL